MDRIIEPGIYKHFKGGCYEVIFVARNAETGERCVVYKALYGNCTVYVRPLNSFASEVNKAKHPNSKQVYRFEKVDHVS